MQQRRVVPKFDEEENKLLNKNIKSTVTEIAEKIQKGKARREKTKGGKEHSSIYGQYISTNSYVIFRLWSWI